MRLTEADLAGELAELDRLEAEIATRRKVIKLALRVGVFRPDTFHPVPRATRPELEWVAYVYRSAIASRSAPKKALAEDLRVSPATAGRWIAAARAQGVLEDDIVDPRGRLRPS